MGGKVATLINLIQSVESFVTCNVSTFALLLFEFEFDTPQRTTAKITVSQLHFKVRLCLTYVIKPSQLSNFISQN